MASKSGRADLDQLVRITHLVPGEPSFYVRGRDPAAFDAVLGWARKSRELGTPIAVIESGLRQGDALRRWPDKRLPDVDSITDAERKQLEYAHSRRAWNAREWNTGPEAVLLAERRGWDAAMAQFRAGELLL